MSAVSPWRRLRIATLAFVAVVAIGTGGYTAFGFTFLDALYQTITTLSTVGFREVEPLDGNGKVFTIVLILVGVGTVLYTFSVFLEVVIEGHLGNLVGRRRMDREIASMSHHVIVCGWGRVGRAVARELTAEKKPFVIVELDASRLVGVETPVVIGDAADDEVLRKAGIARADALVAALTTDAENLYITMSARAVRDDMFIVARARDESSAGKLMRGGANRVVNPQEIGGARMAAFVLQPNVAEFADVVMHDRNVELRLEEAPLFATSPLCGQSLRDAPIREKSGALVVAIREADGTFRSNPAPDTELKSGQVVIAIGNARELERLQAMVKGTI